MMIKWHDVKGGILHVGETALKPCFTNPPLSLPSFRSVLAASNVIQ